MRPAARVAGVKTLVALNLAQQHASVFADRLHDIPRLEQIGVDGRVLAFALLITLATALAVSLFPASQLSEAGLNRALNDIGKGALGSAGGRRLRSAFVVLEVALALSMVIGATLLIRSFVSLSSRDPGFRTGKVMTLQLSLPARKYVSRSRPRPSTTSCWSGSRGCPGSSRPASPGGCR